MKSLTIQDTLEFHRLTLTSEELSRTGIFGSDPIGKVHSQPKNGWHRVAIKVTGVYEPTASVTEWLFANVSKPSTVRWFAPQQMLVVYFENVNDALRFKLLDINDIVKDSLD